MADAAIKQYVFKKGTSLGVPVSGTFELTSRCTLDCRMCYIHAPERDASAAAGELSAQQWIELGRCAAEAGTIYLLLTGGEPLLRPDFPQIYQALAEMGLVLSVNTNGTILTPQILELLRRHPPEKLNITLYGMSEQTYGTLCGNADAFSRVMANIRALKSAGINVVLNTTFTRLNRQDMEAIVTFAKENAIPVRTTGYIFPPVRGGSAAQEVYLTPEEMGRTAARFDLLTLEPDKAEGRRAQLRRALEAPCPEPDEGSRAAACTAGRGSFWITWDGRMLPCGMLGAGADVREQTFAQAWQQTRENIRQYLLPQACTCCRSRAACPVCVAVSSGDVPEDLCRSTRAYIDAFV